MYYNICYIQKPLPTFCILYYMPIFPLYSYWICISHLITLLDFIIEHLFIWYHYSISSIRNETQKHLIIATNTRHIDVNDFLNGLLKFTHGTYAHNELFQEKIPKQRNKTTTQQWKNKINYVHFISYDFAKRKWKQPSVGSCFSTF